MTVHPTLTAPSSSHHSRGRRGRRTRIAAVGALALALAVGTAAPALAHDPVATTNPTDGAVVTEVPPVFSVSTSQPMLDLSGDGAGFGLQVTDASGRYYGDGCLTVDGPTLSMPATLGAAGAYTMVFQYISSDGHTTSGTITFTYAPTDASTASGGSPTPPVCGEPVETPSPAPSATATAEPSPSATPTESDAAVDGDAVDRADTEATAVLALVGGLAAALALAAVVVVVRRSRSRAE